MVLGKHRVGKLNSFVLIVLTVLTYLSTICIPSPSLPSWCWGARKSQRKQVPPVRELRTKRHKNHSWPRN